MVFTRGVRKVVQIESAASIVIHSFSCVRESHENRFSLQCWRWVNKWIHEFIESWWLSGELVCGCAFSIVRLCWRVGPPWPTTRAFCLWYCSPGTSRFGNFWLPVVYGCCKWLPEPDGTKVDGLSLGDLPDTACKGVGRKGYVCSYASCNVPNFQWCTQFGLSVLWYGELTLHLDCEWVWGVAA